MKTISGPSLSMPELASPPDLPGQRVYRKLKRDRFCDRIAREMTETIVSGGLKPGDLLPPERVLAEQFGVSRATVGEAIKILAVKGLVQVKQGTGAMVSRNASDAVSESINLLLRRGEASPLHLLEVRIALESEIAALAAERANADDLRDLREKLGEMQRLLGQRDAYLEADLAFHLALVRATHNPVMEALMEPIRGVLQPSIVSSIPDEELGLREHGEMYRLVSEGKPEEAREAVRDQLILQKRWLSGEKVEWR